MNQKATDEEVMMEITQEEVLEEGGRGSGKRGKRRARDEDPGEPPPHPMRIRERKK